MEGRETLERVWGGEGRRWSWCECLTVWVKWWYSLYGENDDINIYGSIYGKWTIGCTVHVWEEKWLTYVSSALWSCILSLTSPSQP